MSATVNEVLEGRIRAGEPSQTVVRLISIGAHGAFLVFLALVSKHKDRPFVPAYIPVNIVAAPLVARSGSHARPATPEKEPAGEKKKPVIEKPREEKVEATKEALPEPKKPKTAEKPKVEEPVKPAGKPVVAAASAEIELPNQPNGSTSGTQGATGTASFGASVSAFDVDFPFAYYVEQLQSLIGANWLKPNVPEGTACVIFFKVQRTGQVTDIKVETPSGLPFYDRAAARSIYSANPLPPLPPEFKGESLGVHLRFQ